MAGRDAIRDMFFEECEDLLQDLIEGLQAMDDGTADDDCVNAIFRAVHSIKGGAGAFSLDALVGFAHIFETVLDRIRDGKLVADTELVQTLQLAGDMLSDLVDAARDGHGHDLEATSAIHKQLEVALGNDDDVQEEDVSFDAVAIELDFSAIPMADLDIPDVSSVATDVPECDGQMRKWSIEFTPHDDLYAMGHEPLVLLRALAELGETAVSADTSRMPGPENYDWTESYVSWNVTLFSNVNEYRITEVFEFVHGLCILRILQLSEDAPERSEALNSTLAELHEDKKGQGDNESVLGQAFASVDGADKVSNVGRKEAPATLRVEVNRIDQLVNTVGELIINQAMVAQRVRELPEPPPPELVTDLEDYKQLARDIQEGIMDLRMQPVQQLFQRMKRIAREAAATAGKSASLELDGEETKVDKKVIEKLADPLTHMIRNAIDHGLETPEKREAVGKPAKGTVRLSASHKSGHVLIQITDDGGGLDRPRIRRIAEERGLIAPDEDLTSAEIDNLLFRPGFSTASSVTSLSGRGVGMDVVKTAIAALGGRISIASDPGVGSTFTIILPLTLAVLDGMVVYVGDETMVIPIAAVEEAIRPRRSDISKIGQNGHVYASRGDYLPVIDLRERLGQPASKKKIAKRTLLIIRAAEARVALAVDRVIDQRQVVIKSLAKNYRTVPGVSAATILGDGKVALIIDPDDIVPDAKVGKPMSLTPQGLEEATNAA